MIDSIRPKYALIGVSDETLVRSNWTPEERLLRSTCKSGRVVFMPTYVPGEECKARAGVLEREVEGEKLVTRHILDQTRRNGDDLATIKTQLEGVDLKRLVQEVDSLGSKVGSVDAKLTSLVRSLPTIIAEAMRKARNGHRKS